MPYVLPNDKNWLMYNAAKQEPCHGKSVHYCKLPHIRGVEVFKEFFCYYGERKEGAD